MTRRRFAQLTYTSVDPDDGGLRGWQFKQESADLLPDERIFARDVLSTDLQPVVTASPYPSSQEIAAMPRRLVFHFGHGQTSVLAHAVSAGPEASGRPGNVFIHAFVDRGIVASLSESDPIRPIQAWDSQDWLTPYGREQVGLAGFDEDGGLDQDRGPRPGPVDLDAVCAFLGAGDSRVVALGALLDACRASIGEGLPVVLVADDVESGTMWLASIAFLASPQTSPCLTFNTYVRTSELRAGPPRSLLSVVLRADLDAAFLQLQAHWVLLDPDSQAPAVEGGWTSMNGRDVEVSHWSRLLTAAAESPEGLMNHLKASDALSVRYPASADACPYWSLAVSMASSRAPGDVNDVVLEVIDREMDPGELFDDELCHVLRHLLDERTARGTEAAWEVVTHPVRQGRSAFAPLRGVVYLGRALADYDWLLDPGKRSWVPAPEARHRERNEERRLTLLRPDVRRRLASLAQPSSEPSSSWCMEVLGTLEFLALAGVPFDDDPSTGLILGRVVQSLMSDQRADIIEFTGPLCAQVAEAVLGAFPQTAPGAEFWAVLAPDVAAWLTEHKDDDVVASALALNPADPVYITAAGVRCESGYHPALRVAVVRHRLRERAVATFDDADVAGDVISSLSGGRPWTIAALVSLLEGEPDDVARTAAVVTLAQSDRGSDFRHRSRQEPADARAGLPARTLRARAAAIAVNRGLQLQLERELDRGAQEHLRCSLLAAAVLLVCTPPDPTFGIDEAARQSLDGRAGDNLVQFGLGVKLPTASVDAHLMYATLQRLELGLRGVVYPSASGRLANDREMARMKPSQLLVEAVLRQHLENAEVYARGFRTKMRKLKLLTALGTQPRTRIKIGPSRLSPTGHRRMRA